jgi:2-polyprenyl-3-methyl-5-hydroxy-6-metoxy-1,4-benzoquinol methylase
LANLWEEKFSQEGYLYGEEPNEFIREQAWRLEGRKRIVAFAEGEGRNAVFLARKGHDVTAWDYTQSGLAKQSSWLSAIKSEWKQGRRI